MLQVVPFGKASDIENFLSLFEIQKMKKYQKHQKNCLDSHHFFYRYVLQGVLCKCKRARALIKRLRPQNFFSVQISIIFNLSSFQPNFMQLVSLCREKLGLYIGYNVYSPTLTSFEPGAKILFPMLSNGETYLPTSLKPLSQQFLQ